MVTAAAAGITNLLQATTQFVVPVFQRPYAWDEKQLGRLWDDIVAAGTPDTPRTHFIGSVVHIDDVPGLNVERTPSLVIDGQQRLTSVTLLLEAIARSVGDGDPDRGPTDTAIRSYYLLNLPERGDRRLRLLLSRRDAGSMRAILERTAPPSEPSPRVEENFEWFRRRVAANPSLVPVLWRGIQRLMVVNVTLQRPLDDPQLIFESMNSTGLGLTQADLIRNFLLMRMEPAMQERLFEGYWRPMEEVFGVEYSWRFDRFVRNYLTVRTGESHRHGDIYEAYKAWAIPGDGTAPDAERLCADLRECAESHARFALDRERDEGLAQRFRRLVQIGGEAVQPLLLALCLAEERGGLPPAGLAAICDALESYLFRRRICDLATNALSRFFDWLAGRIGDGRLDPSDPDEVIAELVREHGATRFPTDEDMAASVPRTNAFGRKIARFWLERLERHGRKEQIVPSDYTIEHVMPQNANVPQAWRDELGPDWARVHAELLHTIGNLTLTGYNSEYRDFSFDRKKTMPDGLAESPIWLNRTVVRHARWDEAAILERSREILVRSLEIWPRPKLARTAGRRPDPLPRTFGASAGDLFSALAAALRQRIPDLEEERGADAIALSADTVFATVRADGDAVAVTLPVDALNLDDPGGLLEVRAAPDGDVATAFRLADAAGIPAAVRLVLQAHQAATTA